MNRLNKDIILEHFGECKYISNLVYEDTEDFDSEPFWWYIITLDNHSIYITEWFDDYEVIANIFNNGDSINLSDKEPMKLIEKIKKELNN